jgi:2-polyprenyl-6-methoxyphenol hydroxylase-like FAD-dependent oxidoreductase
MFFAAVRNATGFLERGRSGSAGHPPGDPAGPVHPRGPEERNQRPNADEKDEWRLVAIARPKHSAVLCATSTVAGRLLVACGGIHSAARRKFYPDEGLPRWHGAVMWRGVADFDQVLDGHPMIMAGRTRIKFVCYPMSHQASRAGAQQANFIAELRSDETLHRT